MDIRSLPTETVHSLNDSYSYSNFKLFGTLQKTPLIPKITSGTGNPTDLGAVVH